MIISATDPTGGAGLATDIRVCSSLGAYPIPIVSAITVQNHRGVSDCVPTDQEVLKAQMEAALEDFTPDAVKIGLMPDAGVIKTIAGIIRNHGLSNVVVDPVLAPTKGGKLVADPESTLREFVTRFPALATLITPNKGEMATLMRISNELNSAQSWNAVLLTGGDEDSCNCHDTLIRLGREDITFSSPKIESRNLHGTGCTLSSAIASFLAIGYGLEESITKAKDFITEALRLSAAMTLTSDYGPAFILPPDSI